MKGPSILLLTYHFPPASGRGAAGSLKALKTARYLKKEGVEPVVLTLREDAYPGYVKIDPGGGGPFDFRVIRAGRIPYPDIVLDKGSSLLRWMARKRVDPQGGEGGKGGIRRVLSALLRFPDSETGWILPSFLCGLEAIRGMRGGMKWILASSPPFSTIVSGLLLSRSSGIPLIVEFRDPYLSNPYSPLGAPPPFLLPLQSALERWALRGSLLLLFSTRGMERDMLERHPQFRGKGSLIYIHGFDPDDFKGLPEEEGDATGNCMKILHTGFIYRERSPRLLMKALSILKRRGVLNQGMVKFTQAGESDLSPGLRAMAEGLGVGDLVEEIPHLPHSQALSLMKGAHILLILQPSAPLQVPSKVYEYGATGKKIVAVAERGSALAGVLEEMGDHILVPPDSEEDMVRAISECLVAFEKGDLMKRGYTRAPESFSFEHSARELVKMLQGLNS